MPEYSKLNAKSTALLLMDCQNGITDFVPGSDKLFLQLGKALAAARAKRVHVIHVGIGFRPGYPEVHPLHPTFSNIRQSNRFVEGSESAAFHPAVAPKEGEIIIVKHRVSAFSGNDLSMILRAQGITHLVLSGIATSGVVLSTLRQAADLDFQCLVLKDGCFDADEEVHRVLTEKVFARQAEILSCEEFANKIA